MKVTVLFRGICTHIRNGSVENPVDVRVVLVDARFGLQVPGTQSSPGEGIPPHTASLHIAPHFIASAPAAIGGLAAMPLAGSEFLPSGWSMSGVELEIVPSSAALTATADYHQQLPSLTAIAKDNGFDGPLDLDRRIVDSGAAACVFRIRNGTLDAFHAGEAVHGILTVETEGPAQLRVMRMWDRTTEHIELRTVTVDGVVHDPAIVVANTGVDDDKNVDFLLHYGVTAWMPPAALTLPPINVRPANEEEVGILKQYFPMNFTVTHGCSNSIYP
jgi:hypothetical protein